jgi:5-methylcytosine-specific restriction endonuclease McrA
MTVDYAEKLKDPRWQKKRLVIFQRDDWTCQKCHRNDLTLNIHHILYLDNTEPWDYPDKLLMKTSQGLQNRVTEIKQE